MPNFLTATPHTHFDTTDSTNTQLIQAITDGTHPHTAPHLYTASHQTAGRGQHGRTWVSGADNVFLSLYVPIGQGQFELHQLSGLLSLAVGFELSHLDIIQNINQTRKTENLPPIGVKWANDVGFYDDKAGFFKKLAGILIEPVFKKLDKNTLVGVVIGVGLNVNNSPMIKDGLYQATCLKELSDKHSSSFFVRPEPVEGHKENRYGSTSSPRTVFSQLTAQDLYIPMTNAIFQAVEMCNHCQNEIAIENHMNIRKFIINFNHHHLLQGKNVQIFMQNDMSNVYAQGRCIGIGGAGELLLNNHGDIKPIFAGMAKIITN